MSKSPTQIQMFNVQDLIRWSWHRAMWRECSRHQSRGLKWEHTAQSPEICVGLIPTDIVSVMSALLRYIGCNISLLAWKSTYVDTFPKDFMVYVPLLNRHHSRRWFALPCKSLALFYSTLTLKMRVNCSGWLPIHDFKYSDDQILILQAHVWSFWNKECRKCLENCVWRITLHFGGK